MDVLLGLDLGTTNCKALAFDTDGHLLSSASIATPTATNTGWGKKTSNPPFDAEALWDASVLLMRRVTDTLGPHRQVAAVSITSMGEAGVLVNGAGEPLAPILTWHDRCTTPWVAWWQKRIDEQALYAITGLPLDHIYSANKLLWHRQHDPITFARAHTWLCLSDWIIFRLTGERTTSHSMASRTMLFDVRLRAWSEELFGLANLPASLMPPAFPSGVIVGRIEGQAANATGLKVGTPVVTGGHDHICAALAAGVFDPGIVLNSSGTTDTILAALEHPILQGDVASSGLCCGCHTVQDRYYLVGGFMSGAVVDWLARLLTANNAPEALVPLMEEAARAPVLANGLAFLPYLGGSGPPDRDPNAWGAWLGLRLDHNRADLMRAAMEGLSFALRYLLEGHQRMTGRTTHELHAVGGGSRNRWWGQLKADVLGIPVQVPEVSEVTALGAALLAGMGVGIYPDAAEAAAHAQRPAVTFTPDPERHAAYDTAYHDIFLKLYPMLRSLPLGGH
jgi:xylulokinase